MHADLYGKSCNGLNVFNTIMLAAASFRLFLKNHECKAFPAADFRFWFKWRLIPEYKGMAVFLISNYFRQIFQSNIVLSLY